MAWTRGNIPPLLLVSYVGAEMFDASGNMQPAAWPIMGALLVFARRRPRD